MTFPRIAASVLAADFGRIHDDLSAMVAAGVDLFHWDIMDGHFVPNISFGPAVVGALRGHFKQEFDVHLLVSNPVQWIAPVADAGADNISFHIEAVTDALPVIEKIKRHGIKAGLAINPDTTLDTIDPAVFEALDRVIIMTVHPGFGGQTFIDQSMKVQMLRQRYPQLDIMIDGGINRDTAPGVVQAGATTLVSGSALFGASDKQGFVTALRKGTH